MPVDVALRLAHEILALFRASGAAQTEQFAALGIARQLVPLTESSLTPASEEPRYDFLREYVDRIERGLDVLASDEPAPPPAAE